MCVHSSLSLFSSNMDGVLLGDSQLKWLSVRRLQFACSVRTCMFSVGGATAASLLRQVQLWRLRPVKFAVVYVGGNDLSNRQPPDMIVKDILVR